LGVVPREVPGKSALSDLFRFMKRKREEKSQGQVDRYVIVHPYPAQNCRAGDALDTHRGLGLANPLFWTEVPERGP